jgi:hypothetical protein
MGSTSMTLWIRIRNPDPGYGYRSNENEEKNVPVLSSKFFPILITKKYKIVQRTTIFDLKFIMKKL